MRTIAFDIETGPLPDDVLQQIFPEVPLPPPPGPFVEDDIKFGNLGPAKKEEKLKKLKTAHKKAVTDYEGICRDAQAKGWEAFKDKAALNAGTGRVLAIGYRQNNESKPVRIDGLKGNSPNVTLNFPAEIELYLLESEGAILQAFWEVVGNLWELNPDPNKPGGYAVGHNIHGFDLPFLVQRSWINNVPIDPSIKGDYGWARNMLDTMKYWTSGNRNKFVKLDELASYFGIEGKSGSGADFHLLWEHDRSAAIAYLAQDLEVTWQVASRMGLLL